MPIDYSSPPSKLEVKNYASMVFALLVLLTLERLRSSIYLFFNPHWCWSLRTTLLLTQLMLMYFLKANEARLRFFATSMEMRFLLSGILPLIKHLGLLIISEIEIMLTSHAIIWLIISLISIIYVSSLTFGVGLLSCIPLCLIVTLANSSTSHCSFASLGISLY